MKTYIFGLCNKHTLYSNTRHNVGSWCLARISLCYNTYYTKEHMQKTYTSLIKTQQKPIKLIVPISFMNVCSAIIKPIIKRTNNTLETLITYDEADIPPGKYNCFLGANYNGHNGLENLYKLALNSSIYVLNLRIGIGRTSYNINSFVIQKPTIYETALINKTIKAYKLI